MRNLVFVIIFLLNLFLISDNVTGINVKFYELANSTNAEGGPSWSYDGTRIVYDSGIDYTSGGYGKGLWIMNSDGGNKTVLIDPSISPGVNNVNAKWHPKEERIVYVKDKLGGGGGIWIVNSDGTNNHRITFSQERELSPYWSPDGKRIVYSNGSYTGLPYRASLWILKLNESLKSKRITNGDLGDFSDKFPSWSKDGEKIVFVRSKNKNADIWIMNCNGSYQKRLTFNKSIDTYPDINSYNKIVFSSNRDDTGYDLWVMDIDGENKFRLTDWPGDEIEAEWSPDSSKIVFSWDRKPGHQKTDIWIAIPSFPPPPPTNHSMIISSSDWRNVLSAVPVKLPIIVSDSLTKDVMDFIDDYKPDNIYTIGLDTGLNNSYRIEPEDVPKIFFPNETKAVYAGTRDKAVLASQLAYYMNVPLVFDKSGWNSSGIIDVSGLAYEEIGRVYVKEVAERRENINYIVLANIENNTSLLAGRLAGIRKGYVVPITLQEISYNGSPFVVNTNNRIGDIIGSIAKASDMLSGYGMFSNSTEYRKGGPLFLAILGNAYSVPAPVIYDPAIEMINDKDGDRLYTDLAYSDINGDNYFDLAVGRFGGNLTATSLQIERAMLPRNNTAVLIGQYRHGKYMDLMLMGGGMTEAYIIEDLLKKSGFETRRLIENRTEHKLPTLRNIGLKGMFEMAVYHYKIYQMSVAGAVASSITFLWGIAELGDMIIYHTLEYDWEAWYNKFIEGNITLPERLEVLYPDTDIGEPLILGYFGVGDKYWYVPEDNRDEIELIAMPYAGATPWKRLNFTGLLYDDHDISAMSDIDEQVMSRGGTAVASTGIVHDPQTIYYGGDFFEALLSGNSVGEALRRTSNHVVPKDILKLAVLFERIKNNPAVYFKTKYERVLLGDPAYTPVKNKTEEHGDVFLIKPHHSYLAESKIDSEYVIRNGTVYVHNADDYIVETGKTPIPVFVREIILPNGSDIINVGFRGFYRTYRHLNPRTIPWDEHYTGMEEGLNGTYPKDRYWYRTNTLIDGRVLVRIYVPAVMYGKHKSRVLRWGRVSVEYKSPAEVMLKTRNIRLGLTEKIKAKIANTGSAAIKGRLFVWIGEEEYSEDVVVPPGETVTKTFMFTPEEAGEYQVKAVFDSDIAVGPRYAGFRVIDKCGCAYRKLPFWLRTMLIFWCNNGCCDFIKGLKNSYITGCS